MTASALASEVTELVTFPDIAFRINDLLNDENSSAWDIGALIEQDPGLASALLRIANSPIYNAGVPVTAIDRAVTVVGAREVRDLAFGVCAKSALEGIPNELVEMKDFWSHSLYCAAAAKSIAKVLRIRSRDSLFMAGLLHDVGQLVMFSQRPEQSRRSLELALEKSDGRQSASAEREVFGFDHTAVGSELVAAWTLPPYLASVTRHHHDPDAMASPETTVDIVHIANSIGILAELDCEELDDAPEIAPGAAERVELTEDVYAEVIAMTHETVAELKGVFIQ